MVRLLLWNVDLTPDLSIKNPTRNAKERYPKIANILNTYDIVVLNESFLYRDDLLKLVQHRYVFTDKKSCCKFFGSGVVILSKYPFANPKYYHYKNNSYWDRFISKGILKASFDIDGKKFDLYGTHMQQYNNETAQINRKAQVYELINFVKSTNDPAYDVILVGDLNMGPVFDKTFKKYPTAYYSNSEDAKLRNEQYNILKNELALTDLVDTQEICHLLHSGNLVIKKIDVPDYKLSDTGAFCMEI